MGFFHACEEVVTQMASRIQGITVEIGGDTTKLSKALESVNKSMNFRKIITRIISRHSRDGNSLESMMMKASAVHHWSIVKECNS